MLDLMSLHYVDYVPSHGYDSSSFGKINPPALITVIFPNTHAVALLLALSIRLCTDDLQYFGRDVLIHDDESKLVVTTARLVDAASYQEAIRVFGGQLVQSLFDSIHYIRKYGSISGGP